MLYEIHGKRKQDWTVNTYNWQKERENKDHVPKPSKQRKNHLSKFSILSVFKNTSHKTNIVLEDHTNDEDISIVDQCCVEDQTNDEDISIVDQCCVEEQLEDTKVIIKSRK